MLICCRPPRLGPTNRSAHTGETATLLGPTALKEATTDQERHIKYPCYRVRDTQSLKDK